MSGSPKTRSDGSPGYERSDAQMFPLVVFGVLLTVLIVGVCVVVNRLQASWKRETVEERGSNHPLAGQRSAPLEPLLQADPTAEIGAHRETEEELLSSFGWVDSEQGIVRIPIESAMRKLLERGLPTRPTPPDEEDAR